MSREMGPHRLFELRIDGKSLRIEMENGEVVVPAPPSKAPDVVIEADPEVVPQVLSGHQDPDAAITGGGLRVHGNVADARRLFEMFRFPSADEEAASA